MKKNVYFCISLGFGSTGLIQAIVAVILYLRGDNQLSVQILSTIGASFLFIAIIQFVLGQFYKKKWSVDENTEKL